MAHAPWRDRCRVLLALLAVAALPAGADPVLAGVLSDLTRTPAGHSLFLAFEQAWQEKGLFPSANLAVREQPSPRGGTSVTFEYQGRVLFQAAGFGSRADPRSVGALAADSVARRLAQNPASAYAELNSADELR